MESTPNIAKIGALLGDNTRARILSTLMHGKALTASELARAAGVTAQTATTHLAKLESGGLLTLRKQGRPMRALTGPRDAAMRNARVCYNHLAGNKGIQLYDSLITSRYLIVRCGDLRLTQKGQTFMHDFGIDLDALQTSRSPLCRECLDWSERRSHLAGSLGRALLTQF